MTVLPATVFEMVLGAGLEVVMTVMSIPFVSECDVDVADGDGHADLHVLRFGCSTPRP